MLDYCVLDDLACNTEQSTGGSYDTLWVMPVKNVLSIPSSDDGSELPLGNSVALKSGTKSATYKFNVNTVRLKEPGAYNADGPYFEQELTAFRSYISAPHMEQVRRLKTGHYIIQHKDANGRVRVIGTLDQPLRYEGEADTGRSGRERNGVSWRFYGVAKRPAVFLDPATPPPNELPYPSLAFTINNSSSCFANLSIAGSATSLGNEVSALTPNMSVRFRFIHNNIHLYTGQVSLSSDPNNVASWTITAADRTIQQFEDEIINKISASTSAFAFMLDVELLSFYLSDNSNITVVGTLFEGALESNKINATLTQCSAGYHDIYHDNFHE